jgi:hypothetical protein
MRAAYEIPAIGHAPEEGDATVAGSAPAHRRFRSSLRLVSALAAFAMGVAIAIPSTQSPAQAFGGEDMLDGNPWYHPAFTYLAASRSGFSPEAGASLAWHADYIDAYAYNPTWWFQEAYLPAFGEVADANRSPAGALPWDRYISSVAVMPDLVKLHFDDHYFTNQIDATWYRYFTGTLAGLLWAAENDDVAAAHTLLGVSLHAIQDFYSHSSWMDEPDRRPLTWLNLTPEQRLAESVKSGTYEEPDLFDYPHGKPSLDCSIMKNALNFIADVVHLDFDGVFGELCDHSLLRYWSLCDMFRDCCEAEEGGDVVVHGIDLTHGMYFLPPGVALDSRGMTGLGAFERGLVDADGNWCSRWPPTEALTSACDGWMRRSRPQQRLQPIALDTPTQYIAEPCGTYVADPLCRRDWLATDTSQQCWWLIARRCGGPDPELAAFWQRVTSNRPGAGNTTSTRYTRFPFQFITAGEYRRPWTSIPPRTSTTSASRSPRAAPTGRGPTATSTPAGGRGEFRSTTR